MHIKRNIIGENINGPEIRISEKIIIKSIDFIMIYAKDAESFFLLWYIRKNLDGEDISGSSMQKNTLKNRQNTNRPRKTNLKPPTGFTFIFFRTPSVQIMALTIVIVAKGNFTTALVMFIWEVKKNFPIVADTV
ncbi:hypothetical protein KIV10_05460 [Aequorivita echinoideorum]|uniref:Uncharacterized protein n=1 Tax=Aequorivita echinoideorum TaxID=1549647 RepID=A0ABS5S3S6_9FLAO|nr:hypothetical protein [Aequorivita echinoideorum]